MPLPQSPSNFAPKNAMKLCPGGARDHHGAAASAASQTLRGCARATRAGTPAATLLRDVGPCGPPPRPAPRPSPPAYRQQQHHRRHCILGRKGGSAVRAERLRRDAWCAWDSRRWRPGRRRPCEQPVRCDPRTRPVCLPVSLSRGGLIIHPHPSPAALQLALPGWQCQPVLQWHCYAAAYRHRSPRTRVYLHCYISIDISLSLSLCLAGRAIYFCEYDGECIRRVGMDGVIR